MAKSGAKLEAADTAVDSAAGESGSSETEIVLAEDEPVSPSRSSIEGAGEAGTGSVSASVVAVLAVLAVA